MKQMISSFPTSSREVKKTCVQCRQRKVRCISQHPGVAPCNNCHRLRFACVFQDHHVPATHDLPRPELRRVSKACKRCRSQKVRCSGVFPCGGCIKNSVLCEYPGSPQVGPAPDSYATSVSSLDVTMTTGEHQASNDNIITEEDITALIDSFFQHIYPLPSYSFLHPSRTRRKLADGTLDRALVTAIAAVSSLRCPGVPRSPSIREREEAWIGESEALIWEHLELPSVGRLQATLLVVLYRIETAQFRRAFMLAALAGRTAVAMRLNHEKPAPALQTTASGPAVISLEVRRRLMWSLKMVDRYFSLGFPEVELCPVEIVYIRLPCTEYLFGNQDPDNVQEVDDGGAYRLGVKLEMFRRDVMKLHRSLGLYDQAFPQLPRLIQNFQQNLDEIGAQFPSLEGDGSGETGHIRRGRWLPRYLFMKLSWHQCHCDLYRLLLRNSRDAAPRAVIDALDDDLLNTAEVLCVHHAQAIVQDIVALSESEQKRQQHDEPRLIELDSAICTYTASRILLFTARFGATPSRPSDDFALSRAEVCLAAVKYFFSQSLPAKPIIGELTRLIEVFCAKTPMSPSHFSSPRGSTDTLHGSAGLKEDDTKHQDPATQLSGAARITQRLAFHSLLRQAGFSDDDDDDDDEDDDGVVVLRPTAAGLSYASPGTTTTASTSVPSHADTGMETLPDLG